ncbi:MAG TPA: rod shape-determining protein MreC [Chloroflexota bacterium]|nr:rod shape-determining protein MreC [Chloroflexota bacterium]
MFLVAAFLVLFLGRWLAPIDRVGLSAAAPFQSAITAVTSAIGDTISGVVNGPRFQQENGTLRKTIGVLMRENAALQSSRYENQIFRRMLNFRDRNPNLRLMVARVIGTLNDPLNPVSFISRGSRDGLVDGMTVLDQNGYFAGKIVDIGSNWAKVQWVLSPSSSVGAMDVTTRASGVVDGKFDARPVLEYVPTSRVLRAGDFVVTSGVWNEFPRTLLIGQIVSVHHSSSDMFQSAVIQPLADFSDLEIVQVVKGYRPSQPNQWIKP